jgi:hypothetical protein
MAVQPNPQPLRIQFNVHLEKVQRGFELAGVDHVACAAWVHHELCQRELTHEVLCYKEKRPIHSITTCKIDLLGLSRQVN